MRFFVSRNDERICQHCKSNILHGEHYVLMFMAKAKRSFFFHISNVDTDCFMEWTKAMFIRKYLEWVEDLNPPVKRGRPPKYRDSKKANQLFALRRYHVTLGHDEMVRLLDIKLEALKL